jgi:hypothetical protein
MRTAWTRLTAISAVAAVGLLAGCGSGSTATKTASEDPKTAFSSGLDGLGDTDALTVTLKLDATADQLVALSKENPSDTPLTAKQAQELSTASLVIETKTTDGSKLSSANGTSNKAAFRLAVQDNGNSLAEIRTVDNTLYIQADLKTLLDIFGKSKQYGELTARASSLPSFVQAFVQGKWVSLELNSLKSLASQFGASASTNPQQNQKLLTDLKATLGRDVTVTRVGTDDQGDHLKVTAQSRALVDDIAKTVQADMPSAGLATNALKPTSVPDHSVVIDVWVKDGSLSKLSLDLVQFAKPGEAKAGDHLPVVLTFDKSADDISKPAGAVPVDTSQLFTMLGALGSK